VTLDEMYALLQQFKKREGHCNVPQSHAEDGANLGTLPHRQRQLNKNEKLDPERQKRLEEIGFEWGLTSATWDEMYALLQQINKHEGHSKFPSWHKEDGANLCIWVNNQRQLKKKETASNGGCLLRHGTKCTGMPYCNNSISARGIVKFLRRTQRTELICVFG
jgi:hypothetical protein